MANQTILQDKDFQTVNRILDMISMYFEHSKYYHRKHGHAFITKVMGDTEYFLHTIEEDYRLSVIHHIDRLPLPKDENLLRNILELKPLLMAPVTDLIKLRLIYNLIETFSRQYCLERRLKSRTTRKNVQLCGELNLVSKKLLHVSRKINRLLKI